MADQPIRNRPIPHRPAPRESLPTRETHYRPQQQPLPLAPAVAAPPAPAPEPVLPTLHEREVLHFLVLAYGQETIRRLSKKVLEIRAAWKEILPATVDRKDVDKHTQSAEAGWHKFLHSKVQAGTATLEGLAEQIDICNEYLPARAPKIDPLELVTQEQSFAEMVEELAELRYRVAALEQNAPAPLGESRLERVEQAEPNGNGRAAGSPYGDPTYAPGSVGDGG